MNVLELGYATFPYISQRASDESEKIKGYFVQRKATLIEFFKNIYRIEDVFNYALNEFHYFDNTIIKLANGKEFVVLKNKDKRNTALQLFELLVNIRDLPKSDIDQILSLFFFNADDKYYYYRDIKVVEGQSIRDVLMKGFEHHKNNGNEDVQQKFDDFKNVAEFIDKGYIVCRKSIDVLDRVHYETIVNPKIAIDPKKIEDVNLVISSIDYLFNY